MTSTLTYFSAFSALVANSVTYTFYRALGTDGVVIRSVAQFVETRFG